jgi:hypothetical protein
MLQDNALIRFRVSKRFKVRFPASVRLACVDFARGSSSCALNAPASALHGADLCAACVAVCAQELVLAAQGRSRAAQRPPAATQGGHVLSRVSEGNDSGLSSM